MILIGYRDTEAASRRFVTQEIRNIINNDRFWQDLRDTNAYLHPIPIALNRLQGNVTNLSDAFVFFEELQDYFQEDNYIWYIFDEKWKLCESDLHAASCLIDLRYNDNYVKLEHDARFQINQNANVNGNGNQVNNNVNNNVDNNINNNNQYNNNDDFNNQFNLRHYAPGNINNRDRQRNINQFLIQNQNQNQHQNENVNVNENEMKQQQMEVERNPKKFPKNILFITSITTTSSNTRRKRIEITM